MTDYQFLQLLKVEIKDFYFEDNSGNCKSTLGVLELIQTFKKQIQDETIKDFIAEYSDWVPDHEARYIAENIISRRGERTAELQPSFNIKQTLVEWK